MSDDLSRWHATRLLFEAALVEAELPSASWWLDERTFRVAGVDRATPAGLLTHPWYGVPWRVAADIGLGGVVKCVRQAAPVSEGLLRRWHAIARLTRVLAIREDRFGWKVRGAT